MIAEGETGPERQRSDGRRRDKETLRLRYLLDTSSPRWRALLSLNRPREDIRHSLSIIPYDFSAQLLVAKLTILTMLFRCSRIHPSNWPCPRKNRRNGDHTSSGLIVNVVSSAAVLLLGVPQPLGEQQFRSINKLYDTVFFSLYHTSVHDVMAYKNDRPNVHSPEARPPLLLPLLCVLRLNSGHTWVTYKRTENTDITGEMKHLYNARGVSSRPVSANE